MSEENKIQNEVIEEVRPTDQLEEDSAFSEPIEKRRGLLGIIIISSLLVLIVACVIVILCIRPKE